MCEHNNLNVNKKRARTETRNAHVAFRFRIDMQSTHTSCYLENTCTVTR